MLSNLMAIVLQSLCTRLGVGAGRDLAQACRDSFPRWLSWPLWLSAEIAITATDLAEVIGTAIGLNLLFHIPLEIGVIITAADVFLILALQAFGFRWIEAFVVAMLGVIAACFAVQIAMADPDWGAVLRGFAPTTDILANREMLYLALGILGATVMPHNLYLHSGLVQTRGYGDGVAEKREAIKLATIDSTIALCLALVINASILILAAATFHRAGKTDVAELDQAHAFLAPLLGSTLAPTLFAIALLCCGLNSTITATLAGPDRDGGLSQSAHRAVAAAHGDADDRDRAGGGRDDLGRREGDRSVADLQPGGAQPATAVRGGAAGDVHRQPRQDGAVRGAALADGAGRADRGGDHRAECEAGVGLRERVNELPTTVIATQHRCPLAEPAATSKSPGTEEARDGITIPGPRL